MATPISLPIEAGGPGGRVPARFSLYSRALCHLCEEMLADLRALPEARGYPVEVIDVDGDPAARRRYGHKIPVLLFAGELVCHGSLNAEEVQKALAAAHRSV